MLVMLVCKPCRSTCPTSPASHARPFNADHQKRKPPKREGAAGLRGRERERDRERARGRRFARGLEAAALLGDLEDVRVVQTERQVKVLGGDGVGDLLHHNLADRRAVLGGERAHPQPVLGVLADRQRPLLAEMEEGKGGLRSLAHSSEETLSAHHPPTPNTPRWRQGPRQRHPGCRRRGRWRSPGCPTRASCGSPGCPQPCSCGWPCAAGEGGVSARQHWGV